jgi:hypothetical protein
VDLKALAGIHFRQLFDYWRFLWLELATIKRSRRYVAEDSSKKSFNEGPLVSDRSISPSPARLLPAGTLFSSQGAAPSHSREGKQKRRAKSTGEPHEATWSS